MKVFISSVIRGLEKERDAVERAAKALDHTVLRSEDFGALASSAQKACRAAVRDADLVILLLGGRYGTKDGRTGKSPTHEEFEEAQQTGRDVLVLVQDGVQRDADQEAFVAEVRQWSSGASTGRFRDADDLRDAVTKALGRHERSRSAGAVDSAEIKARLEAATVAPRRGSGNATLHVAVAGGPRQTLLSPSQIEAPRASARSRAGCRVRGGPGAPAWKRHNRPGSRWCDRRDTGRRARDDRPAGHDRDHQTGETAA